jgi:hypothetical protein
MSIIAAILFLATIASSEDLPKYYKGNIIAEGNKVEWTPDGKGLAYTNDNALYIYDLQKEKSQKLAEMFIAEYTWLNNDSVLAIEWPENVRERKKAEKIVNYWVIERSGKKHLFAADSSVTNRIPDYNRPIRFSDGVIALEKNPGWKTNDLPQNDKIVTFASREYDIKGALDHYFYATWSKQERGSIHFKNINKETIKTLALRENFYNPELAPDRSRMVVYSDNSALILDTIGNVIADLADYRGSTAGYDLKRYMGAAWNESADKIAFYEIYDQPEDYKILSYYDLKANQKLVLTQSPYYGQDDLRFSPDDKLLAVHLVYDGIDYIVLMDVPEPEEDAGR